MLYEKITGEHFIQYKLNGRLTVSLAETLATEIRAETEKTPKVEAIVFDLQNHGIEYKSFKVITPLGLELRKSKRQMYAMSEDKSISTLLRSEGMDKIITPIRAISEIKRGATPAPVASPSAFDVNFINPFIEGTIHVLKIQCQTAAIASRPILKGSEEMKFQTDIAGLIGITSPSFSGSIVLRFSEKIFLSLMGKMLGEEYKEITQDLEDGAGELLNMIFGHAKKVLNDNGHSFEKALPTIVRGSAMSVNHASAQGGAILIPFATDDGMFCMEIGFGKADKREEKRSA